MKLQQVFDFLAVTQHGSVHAAARATGQTQPAMTKSLRRLERTLGLPLFDRHAKGMRPNDYGKRFLPHAQHLVHETKRARDTMSQIRGERMGTVQYGISAAASVLLAPSAIQRFRQVYPEVQLSCRSGLYHTLTPLLRDGQLDFAICPVNAENADSQLKVRALIDSPLVVAARRDHPLRQARTMYELQDVVFTVAGPPGQPGAAVYKVFDDAGLGAPRVDMYTDGLIDAAALVANSDRMALLPTALITTGMLREQLEIVPVSEPLPSYAIGLFQRSAHPLTPAAEELATQFEREATHFRNAAS
ncbi:LysR substrate-binding domain-containing protein [Achromobacter sp. NPDC008082]|jgi:DNA-binding transcriptional LysR family regulator|uniref:LysR substrate-binding domain-containing protein n=1 Tax=Achromobacter sp. NPDC008082 TaxID=3363888 RepID=UPI0036E9FF38